MIWDSDLGFGILPVSLSLSYRVSVVDVDAGVHAWIRYRADMGRGIEVGEHGI